MTDREILSFTFELLTLHVNHPLMPKGCAGIGMSLEAGRATAAERSGSSMQHFAYYIKWRRGKDIRGKLPLIKCSNQNMKFFPDGKVDINLNPPEHRIECEVRFKHKESDAMLLEKKELEIEVLLLEFTTPSFEKEKSRKTLHTLTFDMRTFLQGTRRGISRKQMLSLTDAEYLETLLLVQSPSDAADAAMKAVTAAIVVPPSTLDVGAQTAEERAASEEALVPLVPVQQGRPGCVGDGLAAGAAYMLDLQQNAFGRSADYHWTSLSSVMSSVRSNTIAQFPGVAGARTLELETVSVPVGYSMFLGDDAPFSTILHSARRDRGFVNAAWCVGPEKCGGTKRMTYELKVGKSFVQCDERAAVVCFNTNDRREFVMASHITAPKAPLVGSSAQLELISYLGQPRPGKSGCTATIVAVISFSNSLVQSAASGKLKPQVEKFLDIMERALLQLAGERQAADARRLAIDNMGGGFVDPLLLATDATSLDFNIWNRLADYRTATKPQLVRHYLERVLAMKKATLTSPTRSQIATLEDLLTLHRQCPEVIHPVCVLLRIFCDALGFDSVVKFCPTLPTTVGFVLPPFRCGAKDPIRQMHDGLALARQSQLQQAQSAIERTQNFWDVLGRSLFSESDTRCALLLLKRGVRPTHVLAGQQVDLLTNVLTIHIGSSDIVSACLGILDVVEDKKPLLHNAPLFTALDTTAQLYTRFAVEYRSLFTCVLKPQDSQSGLTPFEQAFGHIIREKLEFTCSISLYEPKASRNVNLFLTASYLCMGTHVVPTKSVVAVKECWTWLNPAIQLVCEITDDREPRHSPEAAPRDALFDDGGEDLVPTNRSPVAKGRSSEGCHEISAPVQRTIFLFTIWTRESFLKALRALGLSAEGLSVAK